jgi:flagellar assembly factor FliW
VTPFVSLETPAPLVSAATRSISSLVLGDLAVSPQVVMRFTTPMFGFPDDVELALLPAARDGLWWLQSMRAEGVTFLLADPFVLDARYGVDLGESESAALRLSRPDDALSLVMLTLPANDGEGVTANFRAPLVFNLAQQVGMQVVSRDEQHALRRPVTLDVYPAQQGGVRLR